MILVYISSKSLEETREAEQKSVFNSKIPNTVRKCDNKNSSHYEVKVNTHIMWNNGPQKNLIHCNLYRWLSRKHTLLLNRN